MKQLLTTCILLTTIVACKFELPPEKAQKTCQKPLSIVYTVNPVVELRIYDFALNGITADLSGTIVWKLLSPTGAIVSQSSKNIGEVFSINTASLVDATYTITAEATTICSEKVNLEIKVVIFPPANSWTQRNYIGFPTARGNCFAFSIATKAYVGSGYEPTTGKRLTEFYEYDSATGLMKRLADFPGEARTNAVAFTIGDYGYVCTGYGSTIEKNDLWQYDIVKNTWTQKTSLSAEARFGAMGFSINNKGYIGGGLTSLKNGIITYFKDFWEYDPNTDKWTRKIDLPSTVGVAFGVGFSIDGKGYMGLGVYNLNLSQSAFFNSFWQYDPIANTWAVKSSFPGSPRYSAVGFNIFKGTSLGYVGLGRNSNSYFQDFYAYDPVSNSWTKKADFITPSRDDTFSFAVSQKGFVSFPGLFYEYNP